jgi:hypothetical protein
MKSDFTFELIDLVDSGFVEDFVNQMYVKNEIMKKILESDVANEQTVADAEKFRRTLIEFGEALLQQTAVKFADKLDIN